MEVDLLLHMLEVLAALLVVVLVYHTADNFGMVVEVWENLQGWDLNLCYTGTLTIAGWFFDVPPWIARIFDANTGKNR